ncbi:DUF4178 domain-containing protein [Epibacterium ulvae]|uniref:DUF4178 domain-containing protein n=1 Tax=Epibacterium ulvae TaxID=1156985 RepID=UPI001BFC93C4|nr:DUF4178 domain-containing protein [Epibacterium ulvae]MBT8153187.1 DUF4178 domain-containing protein [Epibacterium ulvae]
MTLTSVNAINCTSCGAGLDVLGGGRVTTHICPYCGTELDATANYRALKRFNDVPRPKTPFPIGTAGTIQGVDYTVIGLLEQVEHWGGKTYGWLDHQLYSPTHGYAWLTLEEGHCTFTRRYRRPLWMSEHRVARANHRPTLRDKGEQFKYYETSTSEIRYAEGEFSWQPRKSDKTSTVSVLGETRMLSFSATGREREVEQTTYLSADEVKQGFGMDPGFSPARVHPLQPFNAGPNAGFQIKASAIFAVLCLILAGLFAGQSGRDVLGRVSLSRADLPFEQVLEGITAGELVQLRLAGNGINTWSELELEVNDPEDEVLFSTVRAVERYAGRDADGNWSEGSNRANATFRAPLDGDYTLFIDVDAEGDWTASGAARPNQWNQLSVSVDAGRKVIRWMIFATVVFGLMAGLPWLRARRHNAARWRGSDWVDEDDD